MTFKAILDNYVLWVSLICWFAAQLLKVILYAIKYRELNLERFVGSGGMPSSHTSTVIGLATAIARLYGLDSPLFAIALILGFIVMYDATGVRRAAGEQAKVLNKMLFEHHGFDETQKMLKELLGHTPLEVFGGAVLGIALAMLIPVW